MNESADDEQFEQLKAWLSQRSEDRKVIDRINDELVRSDQRSKRALLILLALSLACMLCVLSTCASAAVKSSKVDAPTITLKRGSSAIPPAPLDMVECEARKVALIAADGAVKESGSGVYDCIYTQRSRIAFGKNPAPAPTCTAPKPAQQAQVQQCPDGTVGTWSQTMDHVAAAYPTCWTPGEWTPSTAPPGICATPNRVPTISGTPPSTATVGQVYTFTPTASDPDGDVLVFTLENRPPWAWFDVVTGTLSGTPQSTDIGVRSEIRIRVQDGKGGEAVLAFGRFETVAALASATLSWTPPTQNTDGTALTDLAGYRIVYGTSATAMTQMIEIPNQSISSYVIEGLSPATYYFALRAYNTAGAESANSNVASKTLP